MTIKLRGMTVLNDAALNKSTALTIEVWNEFGLRGLLPAHVYEQVTQVDRVLANLRRNGKNVEH